jgi:hypothetical protein
VLFDLLANLVAVLHLAYFLFIVLGTVAIVAGPSLRWRWIHNLWFRIFHIAAVYLVLIEDLFHIPCLLNVLQWGLRSANGRNPQATEGVGVVLDALLFSTIPGWVLDVMYVSLGVGLPVLLYLVPPMWRRDRRSLGAAAGG